MHVELTVRQVVRVRAGGLQERTRAGNQKIKKGDRGILCFKNVSRCGIAGEGTEAPLFLPPYLAFEAILESNYVANSVFAC